MVAQGGIITMFDTQLQSHHLKRMNQNVIAMRKDDLFLKFDCLMGDIELSCNDFILGNGKLSFELTDYLIAVMELCHYSIYLADVPSLYSSLCNKVQQVQQEFAEQISPFFLQEVNLSSGTKLMGLCSLNE